MPTTEAAIYQIKNYFTIRKPGYLLCAHPQNSILTTEMTLRSQTIHILLIFLLTYQRSFKSKF